MNARAGNGRENVSVGEQDGELRALVDAAIAASGAGPAGRADGGGGAPPRMLRAAWLETALGPMLAVSDERALLMLEFLERRHLEDAVTRLARTAAIVPGRSAPIDSIEQELGEYFAGRLETFRTPIRLSGTEFQMRVWRELLKIPAGRTISYLELARAVGNPKGFRAVAQANGANPLAVIVPCHRVINTSGELGGYGGGLPRKRWLLEHERRAFAGAGGRLF